MNQLWFRKRPGGFKQESPNCLTKSASCHHHHRGMNQAPTGCPCTSAAGATYQHNKKIDWEQVRAREMMAACILLLLLIIIIMAQQYRTLVRFCKQRIVRLITIHHDVTGYWAISPNNLASSKICALSIPRLDTALPSHFPLPSPSAPRKEPLALSAPPALWAPPRPRLAGIATH